MVGAKDAHIGCRNPMWMLLALDDDWRYEDSTSQLASLTLLCVGEFFGVSGGPSNTCCIFNSLRTSQNYYNCCSFTQGLRA